MISEDDAKKIYEEYTFIVSDKSIFPSFESNFYDKIQKNKIENIELGVEKLFVTPIKRIKIERKSIKEFNELSDIPNNVLYLKR